MIISKYPKIIKVCPVCNKQFDTVLGSNLEKTFCSKSCSNKSRSPSPDAREKISKSLTVFNLTNNSNPDYICKYKMPIKICLFCLKPFEVYNKKLKFCSKTCSSSFMRHSPETKELMSQIQLEKVKLGTHKGWQSREKITPSPAEQAVILILEKYSFSYVREFKVNKWFIDFASLENKIALEIDGSQHLLPDRKIKDQEKDNFLIQNGWIVIRVPWKKIDKNFINKVFSIIQNNSSKKDEDENENILQITSIK